MSRRQAILNAFGQGVYSSIICATTPSACGYASAAWVKLAIDKDYAITIDGLPGGTLAEFADPVTYPLLWAQQDLVGKNVVVQAGVNDTASGSTAGQMVGFFDAIAAYARSLGAAQVGATTVLPSTPYGVPATRNSYNSMMMGGASTADFVVDICPSVWDPLDHDKLDAAYDSGDHLHPNTAGQAQIEAAIIAALGF